MNNSLYEYDTLIVFIVVQISPLVVSNWIDHCAIARVSQQWKFGASHTGGGGGGGGGGGEELHIETSSALECAGDVS